jgi:hypothetical protein
MQSVGLSPALCQIEIFRAAARLGRHNAMALICKCGMGSPLALLGVWQA